MFEDEVSRLSNEIRQNVKSAITQLERYIDLQYQGLYPTEDKTLPKIPEAEIEKFSDTITNILANRAAQDRDEIHADIIEQAQAFLLPFFKQNGYDEDKIKAIIESEYSEENATVSIVNNLIDSFQNMKQLQSYKKQLGREIPEYVNANFKMIMNRVGSDLLEVSLQLKGICEREYYYSEEAKTYLHQPTEYFYQNELNPNMILRLFKQALVAVDAGIYDKQAEEIKLDKLFKELAIQTCIDKGIKAEIAEKIAEVDDNASSARQKFDLNTGYTAALLVDFIKNIKREYTPPGANDLGVG